MRIVALVASLDHVCARYRIVAFRSLLEQAGHTFTVQTLPRYWLTRWSLGREVGQADVVIVQRRLLSFWQLRSLRRQARRLIFDFDDAVFLRDSYDRRGLNCPHRLQEFAAMMRSADAVVAGNPWLKEQAVRWTEPERVHVVPTCVDPSLYTLAPQRASTDTVRLAWIGSSSTLQGLERIRHILERLGGTYPKLRLQLICDKTLELHRLPVDFTPWAQASEARDLAAANIGISWLPDDQWSRGKCGLKVLQYMAAGLPVIANAVGVQAEFVKPGITGFWADDADEWVHAVGRLVDDADLRERLGRAARQVLEDRYQVRCGSRRWLEILRSLEATPPVALRKPA